LIIVRVPLRVSFTGGGSDLPSHYLEHSGAVVSTAINKYIYITVNSYSKFHDTSFLLKYRETEAVNHIDEIKHPLIRECLRFVGIEGNIEITSMADIPAGTGLGSSSSYAVGLLSALYAYQGKYVSASDVSEMACQIELGVLKEPIGKQDQYAAAFGGFNHIKFRRNGVVEVRPLLFPNGLKDKLENNLLMFYTKVTRRASEILSQQKAKNSKNSDNLLKMQGLCEDFLDCINHSELDRVGALLHQNWVEKKKLVESISNSEVDNYYEAAMSEGALGGKICGAGGGGFLLFYVKGDEAKERVRKRLVNDYGLIELDFSFEPSGVRYVGCV
jgi:D-glycero-alpha-D-manno-heptose-7-phosphate kinase